MLYHSYHSHCNPALQLPTKFTPVPIFFSSFAQWTQSEWSWGWKGKAAKPQKEWGKWEVEEVRGNYPEPSPSQLATSCALSRRQLPGLRAVALIYLPLKQSCTLRSPGASTSPSRKRDTREECHDRMNTSFSCSASSRSSRWLPQSPGMDLEGADARVCTDAWCASSPRGEKENLFLSRSLHWLTQRPKQ